MKKGSLFFILLIFSLFISCVEEKSTPKPVAQEFTLDQAKLVSHITNGVINPDDIIFVKFQKRQVEQSKTGINLTKNVFICEPKLDGTLQWLDSYTLVFKPNRNFKMRTKYSGYLDLEKLFSDTKGLKSKTIPLNFEITGREVQNFEADFILPDTQNPSRISLKGKVSFTYPTEKEKVEKSITIEQNGKVVDFSLTKNGEYYNFISAPVLRNDNGGEFIVKIDNDYLELAEELQFSYNLPPLKNLTVTEIEKISSGSKFLISINFSDELDKEKNYDGFVQISPTLKTKIKQKGKKLLVSANFRYGEEYQIKVMKGLKSRWATSLPYHVEKSIKFPFMKPEVVFQNNGYILPSSKNSKIRFSTVNLKKVTAKIRKVFANNLTQFLQNENLFSGKNNNNSYSTYRVGVLVATDTLKIGNDENKWINSELDLSGLLNKNDKGIFIVELSFEKKDMLYEFNNDYSSYYNGDYYNNPNSRGYLYRHGRVSKPIIVSDIGLTAKRGGEEMVVFATNILTSKPFAGVQVSLLDHTNQLLEQAVTDRRGRCVFKKKKGFYLIAEKNRQRSVLKFSEAEIGTSLFDVGGVKVDKSGLKGFIYTDRGVYRPGEKIFLSLILRNDKNTFPTNHPVSLKVYDPGNRVVYQKNSKDGKDGFYSFDFATAVSDKTGNYRVEIKAGSGVFTKEIKVETIVPYKLKAEIKSSQKELSTADNKFSFTLNSKYLFGTPAAGHQYRASVEFVPFPKKFKRFNSFTFDDETQYTAAVKSPYFRGELNKKGDVNLNWDVPEFETLPAAMKTVVRAQVLEKGGRPVKTVKSFPFNTYKYFCGIKAPESGYLKVGSPASFKTVLVNKKGEPVAGRKLKYKIYRSNYYWWYHYDDKMHFKKNFRSDFNTEIIKEGEIISASEPVEIIVTPEKYGELFLEITEGSGGHKAGIFFQAYSWGDGSPGKDAANLSFSSDKSEYIPGQFAKIIARTPAKGRLLVSVEKGDKIISSRWQKLTSNETEISIPITKEMIPNAYVTLTAIQPHAQMINDRPGRLFGIIPLKVKKEDAEIPISIKIKEELKPDEEFEIEINTLDNTQAAFTVAVVDEGLLDITGFKTPDPASHFFAKEMLGITSYDNLGQFIGADYGVVNKKFSVGGDYDLAQGEGRYKSSVKANRFKPVALFKGPFETDEKGYVKVKFKMPDYVGSVRVMVVGTKGDRYARKEKTVPVKTELMIISSLPRVLGPQDETVLTATIFAMKDNVGEVEIELEADGPLKIMGKRKKKVTFTDKGEKDLYFTVKADKAVGKANIKLSAKSANFEALNKIELAIRPSSAYLTSSANYTVKPEETISLKVPSEGLAGTSSAKLIISKRQPINLESRLNWLIRYPYGCVEQTTSAVFPQLYLKELAKLSTREQKAVDKNINNGIQKLSRFITRDGGFAYWPGNSTASNWGTSYAGHFLIEAKKRGYHVPAAMLKGFYRYQESRALASAGSFVERAYRLYIMALAGKPQMGPMNLLKENSLKELKNTEKWLLAAAYKLAGAEKAAQEILKNSGTKIDPYQEFSGSYGSGLRDQGIMLEIMTLFEDFDKGGEIYNDIAEQLSSETWYSTQTTAYALLAAGKYILKTGPEEVEMIDAVISIDGKNEIKCKTDAQILIQPLNDSFGKEISFKNKGKGTLYTTLEWKGISLRSNVKAISNNLKLKIEWFDEDGRNINPQKLQQGQSFWAVFRVEKRNSRKKMEEMALMQILPAGWEIENIRLSGESYPDWTGKLDLNNEEYSDIRDDRVSWFFDIPSYTDHIDFMVKINAVSAGKYFLPSAIVEAMYVDKYKATTRSYEVEVERK